MAREEQPLEAAGYTPPACELDVRRARLEGPDWFSRFRFPAEGEPLSRGGLPSGALLVVAARGGQRRGFLVKQLVYHHVAEGTLGGEPVALAFSAIHHRAIGLIPVVDGRRLHLSAGGLHCGRVLLVDDETGSYWDCAEGLALHGPLAGRRMARFEVPMTSVGAAREQTPALTWSRSHSGLAARLFNKFGMFALRGRGFTPPSWRRTLEIQDARLPHLTPGLGVIHNRHTRFYPLSRIERDGPIRDRWGRERLRVRMRDDVALPEAVWVGRDDRAPPMQLFTRWYAFAFCFPHCPIYGDRASGYFPKYTAKREA